MIDSVIDLLISSALAAEAANARSPFSYDFVTYAWVLAWAMAGGFVSFMRKLREGTTRAFNFAELIGELFTSAFVGVLTFYICEWASVNSLLSAVFISITGHMGSRALFIAEKIAQKWVEGRVGVITTDTSMPTDTKDVK